MLLFPGWDGGVGGMEENKKSGVGDVRAMSLGGSVVATPIKSLIHPIESIQSIVSIGSIQPGNGNIPFWSCLL